MEELGATLETEEETIEFLQPVDTDNDGYVSFEDFKKFITGQFNLDDNNYMIPSNSFYEGFQPEKLTQFRQLFDNYKKHDQMTNLEVIQLDTIASQIKLRLAETDITMDDFNEFFKGHLKTNIVNSEEFGEIIAKYEVDILKIAGIGQVQKNAPIFEVQEENFQRYGSLVEGVHQDDEIFQNIPSSIIDSSLQIGKEDSASKLVYLQFMNQEQKDPDQVLKDIVTDIVNNAKYESYTKINEWEQFFNALKRLSEQIIRKVGKLDDELKDSQRKFVYEQAEKDDYKQNYLQEQERAQKFLILYEGLEKGVSDRFKMEKLLNQMKEKLNNYQDMLFDAENQLTELKPKIYQLEQENNTLMRRNEELDAQIDELEQEVDSYKLVFRQEGNNNDLQKKFQHARETFRGTTKLARSTQAISRLSMKYQQDKEMHEDLEKKYLNVFQDLLSGKKVLEEEEIRALSALQQEYLKNKQMTQNYIIDLEELGIQLENMKIKLEDKDEEIKERKKINIDDRKKIESLEAELRKLKLENDNIQETIQLWEVKYSNQELIKNNSTNQNFRESYIGIMTNNNVSNENRDPSQISNRNDRLNKLIEVNELEELEKESEMTQFQLNNDRGTLGGNFDASRYTINIPDQDFTRGSHNPLQQQVIERSKQVQQEIQHFTEEDDIYDPLSGRIETEVDEEEKNDQVMELQMSRVFDAFLKPQIEEKKKEPLTAKEQKGQQLKDMMMNSIRMSRASKVANRREPSFIQMVSRITNFDFLSLRETTNKLYKRVNVFLDRQKESKLANQFFTEYIYKIDQTLSKHKRILLVTETNIYQLSMNLSLLMQIPIKDITGITIIKSSSAIFVLHVKQQFDFLLETIRRTELIIFLITMCDKFNLPRPNLIQSSGLKILKKKQQQILDFDPAKADLSRSNKNLFGKLISNNFINSPTLGYLDKKSESWFGGWTEKFCVLTNVGMLYYNDPQKRPRNLFPTIDAQIIPISEGMFNKKFVFRMKAFTFDIIFAARTKMEYDRWISSLAELQRETDKKKQLALKSKNAEAADKDIDQNQRDKQRQTVNINKKK